MGISERANNSGRSVCNRRASLLDGNAQRSNRERAEYIYYRLKSADHDFVRQSLVNHILQKDQRLRVLFLATKLGIPKMQQSLSEALMQYGDKSMAEDYLNSGSSELRTVAERWAIARGFIIRAGEGSHRVIWGTF